MKKNSMVIAVLAALALPSALSADISDGFGQTSFPVMMVQNVNARALSLADSTVALSGDLGGITANPASLARLSRMTFNATTMSWLFDSSFQSAEFGMPIPAEGGKFGAFAVSGSMLSMAGWETVVNGSTLGTNGSGDFSIGLNWADNMFLPFKQALSEQIHLDLGLGVRYVQAALVDYTASAISFDFGATYSLYIPNATSLWNVVKDVVTNALARKYTLTTNFLVDAAVATNVNTTRAGAKTNIVTNAKAVYTFTTNWLTNREAAAPQTAKREDTLAVAMAFRNLSGTLWTFRDGESLRTPWCFDLGALYTLYRDARHDLFIDLQLSQPSDSGLILTTGAEYSYKRTIFLRAGYKIVGRDNENLTFGVGLNFEVMDHLAVQADYAHLLKGDLGGSDTFTVSVFF